MSDATTHETNKVDSYILVNCLFTGKFSQVWEVIEEGTPLRFAMKLLLPEYTREREQVQSLKWEARIGKQLQHPNLVGYHKIVTNRQNAYLLMDLFRGPNLKTWLSGDLLQLQLHFKTIVESLCLVLGYLHDKGWVHKDVKPDNVLLSRGGELKLVDFSLAMRYAKGLGKLFRMKPRQIQGTRTYIAPETIKRQHPSPQTDIYSLGVTLFEVLTGQPPFIGTSPNDLLRRHLAEKPPLPSSINPNVTPEMDRLIVRMLAKKPKDRPGSMQEIFGEFRNIKPFKEDIQQLIEEKAKKTLAEKMRDQGLASRLDSRLDAATGRPTAAPQPATPAAGQPATAAPAAPTPTAPTAAGAGQAPTAPAVQPSQPVQPARPPVQQPAAPTAAPVAPQQPAAPQPVAPQPVPSQPAAPQAAPPQPAVPQPPVQRPAPAAPTPTAAPAQPPTPQRPAAQPTSSQPQPQARPTPPPQPAGPAAQPAAAQPAPQQPPAPSAPQQEDEDLPPLPDELPPVI